MEVRLSGGVSAIVDGAEVDVGSSKCQALLAALALSPGEAVSVASLVDAVWGEAAPRTADKTLQTYVGTLRKNLGADRVERVGQSYRLDIKRDEVDVLRFGQLLDEEAVDEALALWRGRPLDGVDAPGLLPRIAGLEERWLAAQGHALELQIERGELQDALNALFELTAEHPLREEFWAQRMIALYRSGRQAEALRSFAEARSHLVEQLGVDPGPRLRKLEQKILDQDESLGGAASPPPPTERAGPGPTPNNLPSSMTSLVGRDAELASLATALHEHRLVTLTGVGGVGKTRLALEAARRVLSDHPNGVWWNDLATVADPAGVLQAVARSIDSAPVTEELVRVLGNQRALIVLDNCEHLLDAIYDLCDEVLRSCPNLTVLATSREGIGLDGEVIRAVRSLMSAEAAALFTERAEAAYVGFTATADRTLIEEVCSRLDNLPLAIELAASRVAVLALDEIATRLDERFRLLRGSGRRGDRHQTLRAAIDWSYDLLEPDEQLALGRLAVFSGTFTLEAAEAVIAGDGVHGDDVLDLMSSLVTKSLVSVERSDRATRYVLLETVRQYGIDLLAGRGELETWQRRHAEYYWQRARELAPMLRGPGDSIAVAELLADHDNLRAGVRSAFAAGDIDLAVDIALAPGDLTPARATFVDLVEMVYEDGRAQDHARFGEVLGLSAWGLYASGSDYSELVTRGERAFMLRSTEPGTFGGDYAIVYALTYKGEADQARQFIDRALATARAGTDDFVLGSRLTMAALAQYSDQSQHEYGVDVDELLEVANRVGATSLIQAANLMAATSLVDEDLPRAWQLAMDALESVSMSAANSGGVAVSALQFMASWSAAVGRVPETAKAIVTYIDSLGTELSLGLWVRIPWSIALVFAADSQFEAASDCLAGGPAYTSRSRMTDRVMSSLRTQVEHETGRSISDIQTKSPLEVYAAYRGHLLDIANR